MTYIYKVAIILNNGEKLYGKIRTTLETSVDVLNELLGKTEKLTHQTMFSRDGRSVVCFKIDDVSAIIMS